VAGAGANYVARYSTYHIRPLIRSLTKALTHEGFAFVEVLSPCPTQYGRRNKLPQPMEMLRLMKEECVNLQRAKKMSKEEIEGRMLIGEFVS
jgi:2-oxoglutarate ferredoxin oxidoreductase subunit beta